jgi:hypothetical protein
MEMYEKFTFTSPGPNSKGGKDPTTPDNPTEETNPFHQPTDQTLYATK